MAELSDLIPLADKIATAAADLRTWADARRVEFLGAPSLAQRAALKGETSLCRDEALESCGEAVVDCMAALLHPPAWSRARVAEALRHATRAYIDATEQVPMAAAAAMDSALSAIRTASAVGSELDREAS